MTDNKAPKRSCLRKLSDAIDGALSTFFGGLGSWVAIHPFLTILFSFLFVGVCLIGVLNYETESRTSKLWVPQESDALRHQEIVRDAFPPSPRRFTVYVTPRSGGNALTYPVMEDLERALTIIRTEAESESGVTFNGGMCATTGSNDCVVYSLLDLWQREGDTLSQTQANSVSVVQYVNDRMDEGPLLTSYGIPLPLPSIVGGAEYNSGGDIVSGKVLAIQGQIKNQAKFNPDTGRDEDPEAETFEQDILDLIGIDVSNQPKFPNAEVLVFTQKGQSEEFSEAIGGDLAMVGASIMIIVAYVIIQFSNCTRVGNRIALSVGGIATVGLSLGVAYGVGSLASKYTSVHSVLPFLLAGIGVDDLFVLTNEFKLRPVTESIPTRLREAMRHAGSSLLLSSLTDFLAFMIGSTTALPALSSFCIWAGFAILAAFILTCTFYAALLVLDERRQATRRADILCCCKVKPGPNEKPGGTIDLVGHPKKTSKTVEVYPATGRGICRTRLAHDVIKKKISPCLLSVPSKIAIILLTAGLLGVAGYGVSQLKQDFRQEWFLPEDSYLQEYYSIRDTYFTGTGEFVSLYARNLDLAQSSHRDLLTDLDNLFDTNAYINTAGVRNSWWRVFKDANSNDFTNIDQKLYQFFNNPAYSQYSSDVVPATSNGTWYQATASISISKQTAQFRKLEGALDELDAMNSIRDDTAAVRAKYGLTEDRVFAYAFFFVNTEQYAIVKTEVFTNLGLALGAVFVVVLVVLANPLIAIIVLLNVAFCLLEVVGFMPLWDVTLDGVSVVNLVLAIGLSVDYSIHIAHAFMHKQGTRKQRVTKSLGEMGVSVINGAVSTFLAVVVLSGSKSYIFEVFFKMFFLTVVFGAFHGLVFLPIILSLIGPEAHPPTKPRKHSNGSSTGPHEVALTVVTSPAASKAVNPESEKEAEPAKSAPV